LNIVVFRAFLVRVVVASAHYTRRAKCSFFFRCFSSLLVVSKKNFSDVSLSLSLSLSLCYHSEIVHIQAGQCGNQIGAKFWEVRFSRVKQLCSFLSFDDDEMNTMFHFSLFPLGERFEKDETNFMMLNTLSFFLPTTESKNNRSSAMNTASIPPARTPAIRIYSSNE
jgi:hypothetical protein